MTYRILARHSRYKPIAPMFFLLLLTLLPKLAVGMNFGKRTHCLVVTGKDGLLQKDAAFSEHLFNTRKGSILGERCTSFDKWEDLFKYYNEQLRGLPPAENQIFIVQAAHGKPGGGTCWDVNGTNQKGDSGKDISEKLVQMSSTHHVAAYLDSCYSGDIFDHLFQKSTGCNPIDLSKLCVATTSVKKHVALDVTQPQAFTSANYDFLGKNVEELFEDSKDGMISSGLLESKDGLSVSPADQPSDSFCCTNKVGKCRIPGHPLKGVISTYDAVGKVLRSECESEEHKQRRMACRDFRFQFSGKSPSSLVEAIRLNPDHAIPEFQKAFPDFKINRFSDSFGNNPIAEAAKLAESDKAQGIAVLKVLVESGADLYSSLDQALTQGNEYVKRDTARAFATLFKSSPWPSSIGDSSGSTITLVKTLLELVEKGYTKVNPKIAFQRNCAEILKALVPLGKETGYGDLTGRIKEIQKTNY